MKTFDEAINYVMSQAKVDKFEHHWDFTDDLLLCKKLKRCFKNALKHLPDCHEECTQEFALALVMSAFELGLATGIEMEKIEVETEEEKEQWPEE